MKWITDRFLTAAGLGDLPANTAEGYLKVFAAELRAAILERVSGDMSDQARARLDVMSGRGPLSELTWLRINVPRFERILAEETELLRARVANTSPALLSIEQAFNASPYAPATDDVSFHDDQEQ